MYITVFVCTILVNEFSSIDQSVLLHTPSLSKTANCTHAKMHIGRYTQIHKGGTHRQVHIGMYTQIGTHRYTKVGTLKWYTQVGRYSFFFKKKSIDGVLGIRTRGRRMVGADETTELWRPPQGEPKLLCRRSGQLDNSII